MQTIDTERKSRINYLAKSDSDYLLSLEKKILASESIHNISLITKFLNFSKDIEYDHPGQTKEIYLAHPFRVACIYKDVVKPSKSDGSYFRFL